jgi:hypothetical protein
MDSAIFRNVRDFLGIKPVPGKVADDLESFADWSMEVGDASQK